MLSDCRCDVACGAAPSSPPSRGRLVSAEADWCLAGYMVPKPRCQGRNWGSCHRHLQTSITDFLVHHDGLSGRTRAATFTRGAEEDVCGGLPSEWAVPGDHLGWLGGTALRER